MERIFLIVAGLLGVLAVVAGTVAAHVLRGKIEADMLAVFYTGTQYHIYHTLALVGVVALWPRFGGRVLAAAGVFFIIGVLLFPGSLYVYAGAGVDAARHVAPYGGFSMMIGWALLSAAAFTRRK